jgi:hypothetical protein
MYVFCISSSPVRESGAECEWSESANMGSGIIGPQIRDPS